MLFIVQSPYWFTIGCRGVFSLGGWTPHLQSGFPEPEPNLWANQLSATGLSPSAVRHSNASLVRWLVRFRSPLLTESLLLSFPAGTEMFQFSAFALHPYTFRVKYPCGWVAPFGNLRITARLPAPLSYRWFQRPSSPLDTKTSITCPYARSYQPDAAAFLSTSTLRLPSRLARFDRSVFRGCPKGGTTRLTPEHRN